MLTESKKSNITPHDIILLNARQWDLANIPNQEAGIYFLIACFCAYRNNCDICGKLSWKKV